MAIEAMIPAGVSKHSLGRVPGLVLRCMTPPLTPPLSAGRCEVLQPFHLVERAGEVESGDFQPLAGVRTV